jgi:uncharacterized repeat protein (TIGR02543 family)
MRKKLFIKIFLSVFLVSCTSFADDLLSQGFSSAIHSLTPSSIQSSTVSSASPIINSTSLTTSNPTSPPPTTSPSITSSSTTTSFVSSTSSNPPTTSTSSSPISSTPLLYTIQFVTNGGTPISPITLEWGAILIPPSNPTKEGHTFAGWYLDSNLTNAYQGFPQIMLPQNITLYAKWEIKQYAIGYNAQIFTAVDGGHRHSIALDNLGRVYTWGANNFGQLGNRTILDQTEPATISFNNLTKTDYITSVYARENNSFALSNEGHVFGWGDNRFLHLGVDTMSQANAPVKISFPNLTAEEKVIQIDPGENHVIALTNQGSIFVWGSNQYGQIGDGTTNNRAEPTRPMITTQLQANEKFIQVTAGGMHNHALTNSGRIFSWGSNETNELGDGTQINQSTPTPINFPINFSFLESNEKIISLSTGSYATLAMTNQGRLIAWGWNWYGQLGTGDNVSRSRPVLVNVPSLLSGESIIKVSTSHAHTVAITSQNRLLEWGLNQADFLGDASDNLVLQPTIRLLNMLQDKEVPELVATGRYHNFFLSNKGRLYSWGYNEYGNVNATKVRVISPTLLSFMKTTELGIYAPTTIYYFFNFDQNIFPIVPWIEGYQFLGWYEDVSLQKPLSILKMPARDLFLYARWQINHYAINYELNGGTNSDLNPHRYSYESSIINLNEPKKEGFIFKGWYEHANFNSPPVLSINPTVKQDITLFAQWLEIQPMVNLALGTYNTYGLTSDNQVLRWGATTLDASGSPTGPLDLIPQAIIIEALLADEKVVSLDSGSGHTLALTSIGRVLAIGRNMSGQLGDATISDRWTFAPVIFTDLLSEEKIVKIEAAGANSYAFTSLSRVFGWGSNTTGMVGIDSDLEYIAIPTLIPFNLEISETIFEIRASDSHVLALTSEGRVFGWGGNASDQLTQAGQFQQRIPTELSFPDLDINESIILVEPGVGFSFAITSEGRILAWGANYTGQLGFQSQQGESITSPVEVPFPLLLTNERLINIEAHQDFAIALTSTGRVLSWGSNWTGQLAADQSVFRRPTPEVIIFPGLETTDPIETIQVGHNYGMAISSTGKVFGWGMNEHYQLGDGTMLMYRFIPIRII